jgi:hypothetical protein
MSRGMPVWLELMREFPSPKYNSSFDVARDREERLSTGIKDEIVQLLVALLMNRTEGVAYV